MLGFRVHLAQGSTGLTQRGAKALGQLPKRLAFSHRPRLGHSVEIIRGNELGVHGEGRWRHQAQLTDLLPHIPRDERNRGSHFGCHPFGFLDPIQTPLAEVFLLSDGANLIHLRLDVVDNELAVSTHTALEVDKVIRMANRADALGHLLSLLGQALVFTAGRVEFLLGLLQTHGLRRGAARTALLRIVTGRLAMRLHLIEPLLRLGRHLVGGPLFGGQWSRNGLAQFMLYMEQVGRVMRPKMMGRNEMDPPPVRTGFNEPE